MKSLRKLLLVLVWMGLGLTGALADDSDLGEFRQAADFAAATLAAKGQAGLVELGKYRFCDGEGFFIVTDMAGMVFMHTAYPDLNGQNSLGLKDARGESLGRNMQKVVNKGGGVLEYWWLDAKTKKEVRKSMYITRARLDGQPVAIAIGIK